MYAARLRKPASSAIQEQKATADARARIAELLTKEFGGYTSTPGRRFSRLADGKMTGEAIIAYEVAFPPANADIVGKVARELASLIDEPIVTRIGGGTGNFGLASDHPTAVSAIQE